MVERHNPRARNENLAGPSERHSEEAAEGEVTATYDSSPWHRCAVRGEGFALKFKGGAKEGAQAECKECGAVYVYKKPKPGKPVAGTDSGPRSHF